MSKGLWQESFGDIGATLKRLETEGITTHDLARLRSNDKQKLIAGHALKAGRNFRTLRPGIIALEPFGPAVFGASDWLKLYGVGPDCVPEVPFPWSWAVLNGPCPFYPGKTVAETHFAFMGAPCYRDVYTDDEPVPLNIEQWMRLHPHANQSKRRFYQNRLGWISNQPFMIEIVQPRWYLMLRDPVPNTRTLSHQAQVDLMPPEYEVPSAIELTTMMILAIEKSHICCCANQFARVRSTTIDGYNVMLDLHSQDMLPGWIGLYQDNGGTQSETGLSASRRLPTDPSNGSYQESHVRMVEFLNALPDEEAKITAFQAYLERTIAMTEAEFNQALSMALANSMVYIRYRRTGTTLRLSSTGKIIRNIEQNSPKVT